MIALHWMWRQCSLVCNLYWVHSVYFPCAVHPLLHCLYVHCTAQYHCIHCTMSCVHCTGSVYCVQLFCVHCVNCTLYSALCKMYYCAESSMEGSDSGVVAAPCSNCDYRSNIAESATVFLYLWVVCLSICVCVFLWLLLELTSHRYLQQYLLEIRCALIAEQNWLREYQCLNSTLECLVVHGVEDCVVLVYCWCCCGNLLLHCQLSYTVS